VKNFAYSHAQPLKIIPLHTSNQYSKSRVRPLILTDYRVVEKDLSTFDEVTVYFERNT